jgi:hypothetical protein
MRMTFHIEDALCPILMTIDMRELPLSTSIASTFAGKPGAPIPRIRQPRTVGETKGTDVSHALAASSSEGGDMRRRSVVRRHALTQVTP